MWKQASKFLGVGVIATFLQYLILLVLAEGFGMDPVRASAVGYTVSAILNYLLNYYFTFTSSEPHSNASVRFAVVAMMGLLLNTFFMYVLHIYVGIHYFISQLVSTGIVLIWNFFANRHWTYKAA